MRVRTERLRGYKSWSSVLNHSKPTRKARNLDEGFIDGPQISKEGTELSMRIIGVGNDR